MTTVIDGPETGQEGAGLRRGARRFPIHEEVRYKLSSGKVVTTGCGQTLDISSREVMFTTEHQLSLGQKVEVSVNWPARLDGTCALKIVASGPVVRSAADRAAIRIDRYEFRTRTSRVE